ncbi:hypothetical protein ACFX1Z_018715 [Malus domestica]
MGDLCVELGGVEDRGVDMAGDLLGIREGVGSEQVQASDQLLFPTPLSPRIMTFRSMHLREAMDHRIEYSKSEIPRKK